MNPNERCLVLVVEDDASIAQFVQSVLDDEGYLTEVAASGEEALESLQKGRPALILLDLLLPPMGGASFLEELRQREGMQVAVILMTATREGVDEQDRLQAEGLLLKPFDLTDLLAEVERVIGESCRSP